MNTMRGIVLLVITLLGLTACLSPVKTHPIDTYTINSTVCMRACCHSRATLQVTTPIANVGYQTSAMLYSLTPYELSAFAYNRWAAPPANMLKFLIIQSIKNTGCFCAVIPSPFAGNTDYRLDTHLIKLQQEFFTEPSQERLVIQAVLVNNKTNKIVFDRRIEAVVKAPCDGPYGGVVAANKATADVLHQLVSYIAQCRMH